MKRWMKIVLIIVGSIFALIALFVGWNIYNNRVDPAYQKFLPKTILSFQLETVIRRPNTNNRVVQTDKGDEGVLLESGYRAFYTSPGKPPFLRIHPEGAPKQSFDEDKAVITRQYQNLKATSEKYEFIQTSYHDHEYYLVGNPDSDSGVRELGAIFFPEESVLVTIYFFNQGPDSSKWDFKDTTEFKSIRDKFINQYIDSVLQGK